MHKPRGCYLPSLPKAQAAHPGRLRPSHDHPAMWRWSWAVSLPLSLFSTATFLTGIKTSCETGCIWLFLVCSNERYQEPPWVLQEDPEEGKAQQERDKSPAPGVLGEGTHTQPSPPTGQPGSFPLFCSPASGQDCSMTAIPCVGA